MEFLPEAVELGHITLDCLRRLTAALEVIAGRGLVDQTVCGGRLSQLQSLRPTPANIVGSKLRAAVWATPIPGSANGSQGKIPPELHRSGDWQKGDSGSLSGAN